mmetsp:Transcript_12256/g.15663  ORF Transcript_12256/g.15663 Transcript_12256/m.15663 type:complete len:222 (-) Transcript_12256:920-1585(-)
MNLKYTQLMNLSEAKHPPHLVSSNKIATTKILLLPNLKYLNFYHSLLDLDLLTYSSDLFFLSFLPVDLLSFLSLSPDDRSFPLEDDDFFLTFDDDDDDSPSFRLDEPLLSFSLEDGVCDDLFFLSESLDFFSLSLDFFSTLTGDSSLGCLSDEDPSLSSARFSTLPSSFIIVPPFAPSNDKLRTAFSNDEIFNRSLSNSSVRVVVTSFNSLISFLASSSAT